MRALVTGYQGFIGAALSERLINEGWDVSGFSRRPTPSGSPIQGFQGDVADLGQVRRAIQGCDIVFHVAAKIGPWGRSADYWRSNVIGTQNIIEACRREGVARLVFTSSPSVVGSGHQGANEKDASYPDTYLSHYAATKAVAERAVIAAHSQELATVCLRPHVVWGEGDLTFLPKILERARSGRLRLIGPGSNVIDATYIDNAVEAHWKAAQNLSYGSSQGGKAYFITNGEPMALKAIVDGILRIHGLPPVEKQVSPRLALGLAYVCEGLFGALLCFGIDREPPLTRWVVEVLSEPHSFDISAAQRDFGYEPIVSFEEGLKRLVARK